MHTSKSFFQSRHEEGKEDQPDELSSVIERQKLAEEYASELANKSAR